MNHPSLLLQAKSPDFVTPLSPQATVRYLFCGCGKKHNSREIDDTSNGVA